MEKKMERELSKFLQFYQEQRLSIIPIPYKSKAAIIKWEEYQKRLPTDAELRSWFGTNITNTAIVCGEVSGNLVVVDCDSDAKFFELKPIIEGNLGIDKLEKHTPVVKTSKGYHIYFKTLAPTSSVKFPRLDIKGQGGYVIAPPSIHPSGTPYHFVNPDLPDILTITSLNSAGIDLEQRKRIQIDDRPNWISEVLQQGVEDGQRNETCFRLAGYFKERQPKDITTQILLTWNQKNHPPLSEKEVITAVNSAYTYAANIFTNINSKREDFGYENDLSLKSGQVSGQVVDKPREYGDLSIPFDTFLKENPEPHWKKEVTEFIGTTYKDPAFIKLVQRRAKDGDIRIIHAGDKIQWVNKDWQKSKISLEARERSHLNLLLPFGAEQLISIPERSQIVIAGDVGAGKTHYGYLIAELNVGKLPIRHFVNEMGDAKAVRLLDDFPELLNHYDKGYSLISQDREHLEVAENLDPNGLNIYDYLHMSATKEWFLLLQKELARLSESLEKGVIVVMLQKKKGQPLAFGGEGTKMQCEVYMTLNIEERQPTCKICRIDIEKCRDWTNPNINPETKSYRYQTAPKHGQLIPYGNAGWFERKED
ncbi:bifunctional DNA primase/polymerase [Chloroflexota bacterium]